MNALFRCLQSAFMALFCFVLLTVSGNAADFASETLEIRRQDGSVVAFTVELALDAAQRQQGLMNRETMDAEAGMLFDFGQTRPVLMWMKDTYLPLDMLFISESGRIDHIRAQAVPQSEEIIDSRGAVRFVLELNGGAAARLNIQVGDIVASKQIAKASKMP